MFRRFLGKSSKAQRSKQSMAGGKSRSWLDAWRQSAFRIVPTAAQDESSSDVDVTDGIHGKHKSAAPSGPAESDLDHDDFSELKKQAAARSAATSAAMIAAAGSRRAAVDHEEFYELLQVEVKCARQHKRWEKRSGGEVPAWRTRENLRQPAGKRAASQGWREDVRAWKSEKAEKARTDMGLRRAGRTGAGGRTQYIERKAQNLSLAQRSGMSPLERLLEELQHRDITPEDYDTLLELDKDVKRKTAGTSAIKALKKAPERATNAESQSVTECAICLGAFADDSVVALPCAHEFHQACVSSWLSEHANTCPICRNEL